MHEVGSGWSSCRTASAEAARAKGILDTACARFPTCAALLSSQAGAEPTHLPYGSTGMRSWWSWCHSSLHPCPWAWM